MNKETICKLSMEYTARVCEGDLVGSHVVYGKLVEAAQNMDNRLEGQKFKADQALKHAEKLDDRLQEKDQEINEQIEIWGERCKELTEQNQTLQGELSEWKQEAEHNKNDLQEHKKLLEKREAEYDQLESQQNALRMANNSLREGMEKRDKKIEELERGTFELNEYKESLLNENKKITERVKRLECELKDQTEKEKEVWRNMHNLPLRIEKMAEAQVTEIEPVVSMRELEKERENFTILERAIFDIDSVDRRTMNNVSSFVFQRYHYLRMKEQQGKTGEVKK